MRLIDFLKVEQITSMFTNLSSAGDPQEYTTAAVSSLMDTWIVLQDSHSTGRRTRELYVLKSRGMAHSREHWELIVSGKGIQLVPMPVDQKAAANVEGTGEVEAAG